MIRFGWNEFDPTEGSATSIDPLKSLAFSVQLGELVFPGTSGRVWRIRYLSALCYLLQKANLDKDASYRSNYLQFRKYENAFILCVYALREKFKESSDFRRVIGLDKAETMAKSNPGAINVIGDILANQMNLGPLGVHSVLMKDLGLVDDDRELLLLPAGEKLAEQFEAALGSDSAQFLSQVTNRTKNVRPDGFKSLTDKILFEYKHASQSSEKNYISTLLFKDAIRRQLFLDIGELSRRQKSDDSSFEEADLIDYLESLNSPLKSRYLVIAAYERFQRLYHHAFAIIRNVPKDAIRFKLSDNKRLHAGFSSIKPLLQEAILDLKSKGSQFLEGNEDPGDTIQEILNFAEELGTCLVDYVQFTEFTVKFHEKHQQDKGKMPWVKLVSQFIEVAPRYAVDEQLPSIEEVQRKNIHNYRFSNCMKIIKDMALET